MRAFITVGLGYGDESKGSIVDFLTRFHNSEYNVRYSGGYQCAHTVVLPDGRKHTFSQFGSGTLAGARTYTDRDVIICPLSLKQEAKHLSSLGIVDPLKRITFHEDCLVATQYHLAANRAKERSREKIHGSCGLGIGETRRLWTEYDACVRVSNLFNKQDLLRSLFRIRAILADDLHDLKIPLPKEWPDSPYEVATELSSVLKKSNIHQREKFKCPDNLIFEGAQGVLLDEHYGEAPHNTWSNVTPRNAVELCDALGIDREIIGVTRTYLTRHGAGGIQEYNEYSREKDGITNLEDLNNPTNEWQGGMIFGRLPVYRLKQICIDHKVDSLAINHNDQVPRAREIMDYTGLTAIVGNGPTYKDKVHSAH